MMDKGFIKKNYASDKDKAAGNHLFNNKHLVNDIVRLASTSCRKCKQMINKRINLGVKILPDLFCSACKKKHEQVFDKINKSLEDDD